MTNTHLTTIINGYGVPEDIRMDRPHHACFQRYERVHRP
jgi:hypothetical protein